MSMFQIDAQKMMDILRQSYAGLNMNKERLNGLNVFPVPDGDTGTNMSLTLKAAYKSLNAHTFNRVDELLKSFSRGSLMGARGNSGVILSQIFGGLAKGTEGKIILTALDFYNGLKKAVETAYKAVMQPVEGTILTVLRESVESFEHEELDSMEIATFFDRLIEAAQVSLENTPELLPVLKTSGVVDAGGAGLVCIFEGMRDGFHGRINDVRETEEKSEETMHLQTPVDIEFGYCTEVILRAYESDSTALREHLVDQGDSMVFVQDEDILKIHIHTNHPGLVLEESLEYGEILHVKIDNMRIQHETIMGVDIHNSRPAPAEKYCVIAVCSGDGLREIFLELGTTRVIQGGQTMNPSTEDILECIENTRADHYIILPNNSNILLAAQQAQSMSDKDVHVIASKSIPQGIAALTLFDPEKNVEENLELMLSALDVSTLQVTYSVRNTKLQGFAIKEKDAIAILDGKIVGVDRTPERVLKKVISEQQEHFEFITIYTGEGRDPAKTQKMADELMKKYPKLEIDVFDGGQPVYYYIASME